MPAPGSAATRAAPRLLAGALLAAGLCAPAAGAGFFVTADGYFVTGYQRVADAGPVLIRDAEGRTLAARVVALDPGGGLALLKAEGIFDAIAIAGSEGLAPGERLLAARPPGRDGNGAGGAPAPARVTSVEGVSGFRFALDGGAAEPGAPLLNADGDAVGVVVAGEPQGRAAGSGPLLALIAAEQPALAQLPPPAARRAPEEAGEPGRAIGRVVPAQPAPADPAEPDRGELLLAEMFRIGSRARLEGDYESARVWLGEAAAAGHAGAQCALGGMYQEGQGVAPDDAEAARWYRKAAAQGDPQAQARLGWMHLRGRGVPRNDDAALDWFLRAAGAGNASGQDALGVMYRDGRGVYRDDARAVGWFRAAALQGDASAQEHLAAMFRDARGVERDNAEAAWWFRRGAEQGNPEAQASLGLLYRDGRGVPRDEAEAVRWFRRAAEQGHALAAYHLGVSYAEGRGVPGNGGEAAAWLERSARLGLPLAQDYLRELGK